MSNNIIEPMEDVYRERLKHLNVLKQISQTSYDFRQVEKNFPIDYFSEQDNAGVIRIYLDLEDRIIALADEIKQSRGEQNEWRLD